MPGSFASRSTSTRGSGPRGIAPDSMVDASSWTAELRAPVGQTKPCASPHRRHREMSMASGRPEPAQPVTAIGRHELLIERMQRQRVPRNSHGPVSQGREILVPAARDAIKPLRLVVVRFKIPVGYGPLPDRAGDPLAVVPPRLEILLTRPNQGLPVKTRPAPEGIPPMYKRRDVPLTSISRSSYGPLSIRMAFSSWEGPSAGYRLPRSSNRTDFPRLRRWPRTGPAPRTTADDDHVIVILHPSLPVTARRRSSLTARRRSSSSAAPSSRGYGGR